MANLSSPEMSPLQPNISFTVSSLPTDAVCFIFGWTSVIFTTFTITNVFLLLPLSILILYQGLRKWRRNPSSFSSASMSHCDCFTYNTAIMELIAVFGCLLCFSSVFIKNLNIKVIGALFFFFKWYGEVFFHVLTCLERYMAVVHPITYLSLRNDRGIRIRNFTVACVWILSSIWISLFQFEAMIYWELTYLMLALVIISFCSISCLCVLIRPGPGERGDDRKNIEQSKRRAFFTIVSTLGVLMLRVACNVTLEVVYSLTGSNNCVLLTSSFWFHLPSSLVLPILFVHREKMHLKWECLRKVKIRVVSSC